ncbi:MAG: hypothetical protein IKU10_06580 [Clostridia bacterium]|nr:hypothetical protein [Clostridia bacterium]
MKKIKLNHDMIVEDYKHSYLTVQFWGNFGACLFSFILFGVWFFFYQPHIGVLCCSIVSGFLSVSGFIMYLLPYFKLRKGNYTMVADSLLRADNLPTFRSYPYVLNPFLFQYKPYHFVKSGACPITINHITRDQSADEFDRRNEPGDPCFVLHIGSKVRGMYNQRIFEYDE